MLKHLVGALLVGIPMFSFAQLSTCQGVYSDSVRNINVSTRLQVERTAVFNEHCESNGSMRSSSSRVDLAVPIKAVTGKFGLSQDQQQQEMQQFCKTAKDDRFRTDASFNMSNTVVVDALRSYNQCIAFEKRSVQISHTANEESIVVRIDYNPTISVVELNSVSFDETRANCTSTILGGGAKPILFSTGKVAASGPFVISCKRTPKLTERGKQFSRISFLISTNQGDYDVVMAPETLFNFDIESITRRGFEAYKETLGEEQETTRKLRSQNAVLVQGTQSKDAEIAALKSKMSNPTAQIFSVLQGEGAPIPCPENGGDHLAYVKNSCGAPGVLSVLTKTPEIGGGRCGYRTWRWACVTYP